MNWKQRAIVACVAVSLASQALGQRILNSMSEKQRAGK